MNLILIEKEELDSTGHCRLHDHRARHIREVLRAKPSDQIVVGLLEGPRGTAEIVSSDAESYTLRCSFDAEVPPRSHISIMLAMPRPKVLKRLWAQLAAMGVDRIFITNAARVEKFYFDSHVIEPGFYRPLLREGLQQARDTREPIVSIHRELKPFVEDELERFAPDSLRLVADHRASQKLHAQPGKRVLLAVGPEGGWTPYELELLGRHGFTAVGMGARTLRTDTACIALLTLAGSGGVDV